MPKAANDNVGQKPAAAVMATRRPCPICGKAAQFETRPFCSKRCADVDLHRWLGGSYAVPAASDGSDPAQDCEPPDR